MKGGGGSEVWKMVLLWNGGARAEVSIRDLSILQPETFSCGQGGQEEQGLEKRAALGV